MTVGWFGPIVFSIVSYDSNTDGGWIRQLIVLRYGAWQHFKIGHFTTTLHVIVNIFLLIKLLCSFFWLKKSENKQIANRFLLVFVIDFRLFCQPFFKTIKHVSGIFRGCGKIRSVPCTGEGLWTRIIEVCIFEKNFYFWPKILFLTKIWIFDIICIFDKIFYFRQKFVFLIKLFIVDKKL